MDSVWIRNRAASVTTREMPIANPLGVNGPRQRKTTGRLRRALTNIVTKQNPYPEYVVQRLPFNPASPGGTVRTLPAPKKVDPATLVEELRGKVSGIAERTLPEPPAIPHLTLPAVNEAAFQAAQNIALAAATLAGVGQRGIEPGMPVGGGPKENMALGKALAARLYGWTGTEWQALRELWMRESGWRADAVNPSSGALGIPQRLPGAHPFASPAQRRRWASNPRLQILWGLRYIAQRYGSPSRALAHSNQFGWY